MISRVPVIHADLGPSARAAFGRWVAAVYGLVAHLEICCFGCTAEQTRCSDGDAAVDDEQAAWQAWRGTADGAHPTEHEAQLPSSHARRRVLPPHARIGGRPWKA